MATMPLKIIKTLQPKTAFDYKEYEKPVKVHGTSLNVLAMDVLLLLDSVDEIDMDDEEEDELYEIPRHESKQDTDAARTNHKLSKKASAHQSVKQIKNENLRKLMYMQEMENSVSRNPDIDGDSDIVSPTDSPQFSDSTFSPQSLMYPHTFHGQMLHIQSDHSTASASGNDDFDFHTLTQLQNAQTYHAPPSARAPISKGGLFSQSAFLMRKSMPPRSQPQNGAPINLVQSYSPRASPKTVEEELDVVDLDITPISGTKLSHVRSLSESKPRKDSVYVERPIKEVARLMYDLLDKQDRKYKRRTYTDCFVGRDAVTVMDRHKLCLHRNHAVLLFREMEQHKIIHHVLYEKGGKFCDDRQSLYQFTIDDDGQPPQQGNHKKDLDVAFGLLHEVDTQELVHLSKNNASIRQKLQDDLYANDGVLPEFTKLRSEAIAGFDLEEIQHKRRLSTMADFQHAQNEVIELPELSGWMFKRSSTGFHQWQRRWVVVRRTHILWSSQQTDTGNPLDPKERAKFNNSFTLLCIKGVRPVSSKNRRKFDVILPNGVYHFRCLTAEQRQLWLNGLHLHLKALADSMRFLRKSVFFKPNK